MAHKGAWMHRYGLKYLKECGGDISQVVGMFAQNFSKFTNHHDINFALAVTFLPWDHYVLLWAGAKAAQQTNHIPVCKVGLVEVERNIGDELESQECCNLFIYKKESFG